MALDGFNSIYQVFYKNLTDLLILKSLRLSHEALAVPLSGTKVALFLNSPIPAFLNLNLLMRLKPFLTKL